MKYVAIDPYDIDDICEYIADTFPQVPNSQFAHSLLSSSMIDWNNSIKAVDDNGEMLGFILLSTASINNQTFGHLQQENPQLFDILSKANYTTIYMIGCNRQYSRTNVINAKMLLNQIKPYLMQFDYILLSIFNELTTHRLWQAMGARKICEVMGGSFYIVPNPQNGFAEHVNEFLNEHIVRQVIREMIYRNL